MRKSNTILCACVLAAHAVSAFAMHVQSSHSGSWWNAGQSGHGVTVEVLGHETMLIYWNVYNPDGTSTFLLTVAGIDGDTAAGTTYYYSGMKFGEFDPSTLNEQVWGTTSITFADCGLATMNYDSTMLHKGVPFGSGTIELTRFSTLHDLKCKESILQGNYAARLVSTSEPGNGRIIIDGEGNLAFAAISRAAHVVGLGQVTMTGEDAFSFEVEANALYGGDGTLGNTGTVTEGGVTLDLGDYGLLQGEPLASFQERVSMQDLAGEYEQTDFVFYGAWARLSITDAGTITGRSVFGCDYEGAIGLPDPGFNQVVFEVLVIGPPCSSATISGAGTYDHIDGSIYLVLSNGGVVFEWLLNRVEAGPQ